MDMKQKGLIEKVINILLNVFIGLFGIILLISLYNNIQVRLFGKEYSDFFGYSVFEVQTGSMTPEINPGDWIIVKSTQNIELDDIITYKQDGEYITHRVIGAYNGTYVTKGDANNSKDEPIDKKQVVGKLTNILSNFGIFKKTIFNPIVLAAIIITILICNFVFKKNKKEQYLVLNVDIKNKLLNISNNVINKVKNNISKKKEKTNEEKNVKEEFEIPQNEEQDSIYNDIVDNFEEQEEISSYIPVDVTELDDTFLEIAQNEIEEETPILEVKKVEQVEEEIKESTPKLNLELLENGKKSKNIIDKFISIKVEELNEIINILDDDGKTYVNEATIKNKLLSSYIDSKYYNYFGETDVSNNKKQTVKIEKYMNDVADAMNKKYKGTDTKYSDKVNRFLSIFNVIINLEQAKLITDKKAKEEFYKKELTKYSKACNWDIKKVKTAIFEIMKIQRNYIGITEYLFKKLETNMFELEFNKLKTNKNIYGLSLEHNISFGKIYSDYIIDKTYNEGVIAENKIIVLLNLLSIQLVKDMIESEFNKKYVLYLPKTLYSKEKKLEKILRMIEDEHAKESTVILMKLEHLLKYKTVVKKLKKQGYNFAIALNSESKIDEKNYNTVNLVDYIFVDKNIPNIVKTLSSLPEDIVEKIVYEDITEKIGDFGGE